MTDQGERPLSAPLSRVKAIPDQPEDDAERHQDDASKNHQYDVVRWRGRSLPEFRNRNSGDRGQDVRGNRLHAAT